MKRQKPLVTQHVEKISRKFLEEHQDVIKEYVKGQPGVYALYRRGKLHYVGLAVNLLRRLKQHLRDSHGSSWDQFSIYLTIGDEHMKEMESLLLRIVDPPGNKVKGRFSKSQNLKPIVRRAIRQKMRQKADSLFESKTKRAPARRSKAKPAQRSKKTGRKPVLAPYLNKINGVYLKATYKGKVVKARVRKDGTLSVAGEVYNSPSLAAAAVVNRRTCNGWTFWKYKRSPGNWLSLNTLRK